MASLQRDAQMDKVSEELKKKRGNDTLMELHEKKMKKKEKKEKEKNKPVVRRPFDRDVDLQANRYSFFLFYLQRRSPQLTCNNFLFLNARNIHFSVIHS